MLLFAAVTGVIATLQYFTQAAVAGRGRLRAADIGGAAAGSLGYPDGSTLTFPHLALPAGFQRLQHGLRLALAVVLFVVVDGVHRVLLRRLAGVHAEEMA